MAIRKSSQEQLLDDVDLQLFLIEQQEFEATHGEEYVQDNDGFYNSLQKRLQQEAPMQRGGLTPPMPNLLENGLGNFTPRAMRPAPTVQRAPVLSLRESFEAKLRKRNSELHNAELSHTELKAAQEQKHPARPSVNGTGTSGAVSAGAKVTTPDLTQLQGLNYSDEQLGCIADESRVIVTNAFAGTGKTAMAVGFAQSRPHAKILYLAFAKPMQLEAAARFPSNTMCRTTHSMAYAAVGHRYQGLIDRNWRAKQLADTLECTYREAAITREILLAFFQSADEKISIEHHSLRAYQLFNANDGELVQASMRANHLWHLMQSPENKVSLPDDAYLKMWGLSNPQLNYDYIIFDEAQDANPVTNAIVQAQSSSHILCVGDRHQSIYGFRGAVNAMNEFEAMQGASLHTLTQTWRFGERTADIANAILSGFKGETHEIVGCGVDGDYQSRRGSRETLLSRTNAFLFQQALTTSGYGLHWVGGVENYQFGKILDTYHLYNREPHKIRDLFIRRFDTLGAMQAYADEARDKECSILCELVKEHGHQIPKLIKMVVDNAVPHEKDASMVLTTAHKSKGLDWDYVRLANDFSIAQEAEEELLKPPEERYIDEQEVNLLYVAVTRAKKAVKLDKDTGKWYRNLEGHLQQREIAHMQHEERKSQLSQLAMRPSGG